MSVEKWALDPQSRPRTPVRAKRSDTEVLLMQKLESTNEITALFNAANRMARGYRQIGLVEPDDLVQKTMLKVLNRTGGTVPTMGWLFTVMRTTAIDAGRRLVSERRYICPELARDSLRVSEQTDQYAYARACEARHYEPEIDLMPRIKNMLANLSKASRQVLVLYAEGYTYEEISRLTRTPIGTVRSRLHYARRRAKDLLLDLA
jgi:RNA polymerase sigma-70 factor (ECF subfamily)